MSAGRSQLAPSRAHRRPVLVAVAGMIVALFGVVIGSGTVSAHTSFESSTPSNGAMLAEPVGEIRISFTNPATEAGDGFVVLDPSGQIRTPSSVTTDDGRVFVLAFDPPLGGGQVGVRWSVRAGDAHPIEGSFSFTAGDTTIASTVPAVAAPGAASPIERSSSPTISDSTTASTAAASTAAATSDDDMSSMSAEEMAAMDEFLTVDQSRPGESLARIGRLVSFAAIVLGIGAMAFAATTLRGSRDEIESLIIAIRILGGVVVIGALAEYVGVSRIADDALTAAWSSSAGFATLLRAVGGGLIAFGLVATTTPLRARERSLSAAVQTSVLDAGSDAVDPGPARRRWTPDRSSAAAFVGVGLAVMSFWFDGHTVTKGFRALHALANSVHVVAGSVWVGGVVTMAVVLWSRHRAGRPSDALGLVVRFSAVASVALGAVVAAGLVMAIAILDSPGELTSTQWGQTLLLKSAAACLAIAAGAYNHFRLMPALERDPHDEVLHQSVRATVTAEAILLVFVVVVTAWLVAAAS
ncbi:MAG TPA: CopD family protein [Ilumatobacteraceae bacterium]|nr:CopD family protein [Ilumatobacteraceae bacterium]